MWEFLKNIMDYRIEQIRKSAEEEGEANTSESAESINVSDTFLTILKSVTGVLSLYQKNKIFNKGKKMISMIEPKMNDLFQNVITSETETGFDDIIVLAIAYHYLGHIYVYKRNVNAAKDHFVRCIELLKGKELDRRAILTAIHVLYDLHNAWEKLQKLENCYPLLVKAMELYLNYTKEEDEYPDPIYMPSFFHFVIEKNLKISLIELHKLTLGCIAELYQRQPGDKHKFVIYVHNLLNKQVTKTIASIDKSESMYWANASFDLCDYFIYHECFVEAKIYLAATDYMLGIHYTLIIKDQDYSACSVMHKTYELSRANVAMNWGLYGIRLLSSSKRRLLQCESDKSCEANNIQSESPAKFEEGSMKPLEFVDLKEALENIEMPDTCVSSLDDAKIVFANALKWFNKAKTHYTAEKALPTYVEIILNICEAYKYYMDFVGNTSKQIKLIKECIKVLEHAVSIVLPRCNTLEEYSHCKDLYFHLAITYSMLLEMTSEEFHEIKEITDEMRMETKRLTKSIVDNFQLFLKRT